MSTAGSQYNYDYAPVIDLHPSWRTHVHNDADSGRATTICAFDASTGRLALFALPDASSTNGLPLQDSKTNHQASIEYANALMGMPMRIPARGAVGYGKVITLMRAGGSESQP